MVTPAPQVPIPDLRYVPLIRAAQHIVAAHRMGMLRDADWQRLDAASEEAERCMERALAREARRND